MRVIVSSLGTDTTLVVIEDGISQRKWQVQVTAARYDGQRLRWPERVVVQVCDPVTGNHFLEVREPGS